MTPIDRDEAPQEDSLPFERWLLDSARADELPQDVSRAWERFGASLASVGSVGALGAAAGASRVGSGVAPTGAWGKRVFALKWLVCGAFVGSALTLLGLGRARHRRAQPEARPADVAVVASVASSLATAPMLVAAPLEPELVVKDAAPLPRPASAHSEHAARASASSLGAQVALLDAARAAVATGAFTEALQATARYERAFPHGELLPDAEVVAIEALSAQGDRQACAKRAAQFLARYPNDPHAARVKALAEP